METTQTSANTCIKEGIISIWNALMFALTEHKVINYEMLKSSQHPEFFPELKSNIKPIVELEKRWQEIELSLHEDDSPAPIFFFSANIIENFVEKYFNDNDLKENSIRAYDLKMYLKFCSQDNIKTPFFSNKKIEFEILVYKEKDIEILKRLEWGMRFSENDAHKLIENCLIFIEICDREDHAKIAFLTDLFLNSFSMRTSVVK